MMPRPGREGAEVIAPRHAKSPVVEVSPNGHAGAPGPGSVSSDTIVWG